MFDYTQDFTIRGKWWIPGKDKNESDGVFGELNYSKSDGLSLATEGSLLGTKSIHDARPNLKVPLVVGAIGRQQNVSLFDLTGSEFGESEWIKMNFAVSYGLFSKEGYFAVEDLEVSGVNFSTNIFNHFLRDIRHSVQLGAYEENKKNFYYSEVEPLALINNEVEVYFLFSHSFKGLGRGAEEFVFTDKVFLNINFKQRTIPFSQIPQKIKFYKDFFSFFSFQPVVFNKVNVYTPDENGNKVEFAYLGKEINQSTPSTGSINVLLFYKEMEAHFNDLFQGWLDNEGALNSGLSLYLQTKTGKTESKIQSFINVVFATETLHNTYFEKTKFSPDEITNFKVQRKRAIDSFDTKFKKKVNDSLSQFNTLSFSERLKHLIEESKLLVSPFIYDVNNFCTRVKKQRNFLAHNHAETKNEGFPEEDYSYFISILKLIFECALLKTMGLQEMHLELMIKRNFTYQHHLKDVPKMRKKFMNKQSD